jgi:hypothetical protein
MLPKIKHIDQNDTHRLIPARYANDSLKRLSDNENDLNALMELEQATNGRLLAESGYAPDIHPLELVFRVPFDDIINAAFTYPQPQGSRFNSSKRGAWYAAFDKQVALSEVIYHKTQALWEIGYYHDKVEYQDFLADFVGDFHDIRNDEAFKNCTLPNSYIFSQQLAAQLLISGSLGLIYPSVRHEGGTNIVCFRPALVDNVRRGKKCTFTWSGNSTPQVEWAQQQ